MYNKIKRIVSQANTYFTSRDEYNSISRVLEDYSANPAPVNNINPLQCKKAGFVVGGINQFGGGTTSVLRIGSYMADFGVDVVYIIYSQNVEISELNAKFALPACKGRFMSYSEAVNDKFDFVIATYWTSVYKALKLNGYKVYFVQDYEPLFFGMGEEHLLAKKSYEMGFHIISLGKWNIDMINNNIHSLAKMKMDFVPFPYEPDEYQYKEHDFDHIKEDRNIKFAIYIRSNRKRVPNLLQWIMGNLEDRLKREEYTVTLNYFGIDRRYPLANGNNLGKMSKDDLRKLYDSSDIGVVASMTNISLVPYEMIAAGLPVIEFLEGSYSAFFPDNSAILTDINSSGLEDSIMELIKNPSAMSDMNNFARKQIEGLSWNDTSARFLKILQQTCEKNSGDFIICEKEIRSKECST